MEVMAYVSLLAFAPRKKKPKKTRGGWLDLWPSIGKKLVWFPSLSKGNWTQQKALTNQATATKHSEGDICNPKLLLF